MKIFGQKIRLRTSAILLIILCWSCAVSGVVAHFSVASTATANARIAVYAMTVQENTGNVSQSVPNAYSQYKEILGHGQTYKTSTGQTYTITNKDASNQISEIAMSYKVIVTLSKKLPTGTTISLQDNKTKNNVPYSLSEDSLTYTFSHVDWQFPANQEDSRTITLNFTTDNTNNTAAGTGKDITVTVSVVSEQIS